VKSIRRARWGWGAGVLGRADGGGHEPEELRLDQDQMMTATMTSSAMITIHGLMEPEPLPWWTL
jgi:hypothetical protein